MKKKSLNIEDPVLDTVMLARSGGQHDRMKAQNVRAARTDETSLFDYDEELK